MLDDPNVRALEEAADYMQGLLDGGYGKKEAFDLTKKKYPKAKFNEKVLLSRIKTRRSSSPREAETYIGREILTEPPATERPQNWIPIPNSVDVTFTSMGDHVELADKLREVLVRFCGIKRLVDDEGQLYRYDDATGKWTTIDLDNLAQIVHCFSKRPVYQVALQSGDPVTNENGEMVVAGLMEITTSKVAGTINTLRKEESFPEFFKNAVRGIAFQDKFVEVKSTGLIEKEHSYENRIRFGYPFKFPRAGGQPKMFLKLLRRIWRDDPDTENKIRALQEFGGASLCGIATRYQRAMAFNGTGQNGKSLILEILQGCFPPDTVSAVPPQADRYEYPRIRGKLLNCVADIPKGALEETAFFKMAVAGDPITCRDVGQPSITFQPIAGQAYGMNRFPDVDDYSEGFSRRWILIDFPYKFSPGAKRIADSILQNPEELAALVRWFLEGAVRLIANRGYTIPACHEVLLSRWQSMMDPCDVYIKKRLRVGTEKDPWLSGATIYDDFVAWMAQQPELAHELPPHRNVFGQRLTGARFKKNSHKGGGVQYRVAFVPGAE